ncbi:hypothetical protein GGR53DRAFT_516726 [Hypoxylon sp. FL1150]|nr:hypothetical protein GGR53DRAFT_516726 [Hypoxylon sp. FL1150]
MAPEKTPFHNDSNWTFMYIVLGLIPVAFVAVAVYSSCQKTATKRGNDIEMANPSRPSFPRWKYSDPYESRAVSIPPAPPSKDQWADQYKGRRSGNFICGIAVSGDGNSESSSRRPSQDFENVPF